MKQLQLQTITKPQEIRYHVVKRLCADFFLPVLLADPSHLCNFIMESLIFFDHLLHMNTQLLHLLLLKQT